MSEELLSASLPVRPSLPPALARRLDRLAGRVHRFHRWAHHPLCARYQGEVLRVGRTLRLCRGCALVALGAVTGAVAGVGLPTAPALLGALAAGVAVAMGLALRRAPGPRARTAKWLTRALPVALCAATVVTGLRAAGLEGALAATVGVGSFAAGVVAYRRRGPDRSACAGCPERSPTVACSGVAPIVRRERAFRRLSRRLIDRARLA